MDLEGVQDSDSDFDTDEEIWNAENREDPYTPSQLQAEEAAGKGDKMYLAEVYWAGPSELPTADTGP